MNHTTIVTECGTPMVCRVVFQGEKCGRAGCLIADETLVELYDARFDFEPWLGFKGQFVSRYKLDTFLGVRGGLGLDFGIPAWTLGAGDVAGLQRWVTWRVGA